MFHPSDELYKQMLASIIEPIRDATKSVHNDAESRELDMLQREWDRSREISGMER